MHFMPASVVNLKENFSLSAFYKVIAYPARPSAEIPDRIGVTGKNVNRNIRNGIAPCFSTDLVQTFKQIAICCAAETEPAERIGNISIHNRFIL